MNKKNNQEKKYKTIGVLGGMGPEATAELYKKIIQIFQKKFGAVEDDDYPEIVIINVPIPTPVESFSKEKETKEMLVAAGKKLKGAGVDFIALPCNTVSCCIPDIKNATGVPTLSIPEEVAKLVKEKRISCVGLLGTEATINGKHYNTIKEAKILTPTKDEQKKVTQIIMRVLAGKKLEGDKSWLLELIKKMKCSGAQEVILGCTDIPILIKDESDTIDTIEVLAEACVKKATE